MMRGLCSFFLIFFAALEAAEGLPLFYFKHPRFVNFGDYISLKVVERMVGQPVRVYQKHRQEKKLLAIGSIVSWAADDDVVWGSGVKRESMENMKYNFASLDVRAVRGPLSRAFLQKNFGIVCPEVYGDPALLVPLLFPEFQKPEQPMYDYLIIPHYSEQNLFPKDQYANVVYPTDPWDEVIRAIIASKFVIASSLHGIILAEAFGVPARMLRLTDNEPLFKYLDYYLGTGRSSCDPAYSVEEALQMGGQAPVVCDLKALYNAFPFEYWS